jgi:hypothetical protein
MSDYARAGRLDRAISFVDRAAELAIKAVFLVGLLCLVVLMIAGTYGLLHNGNDFTFGGGHAGEGDLIVPLGLL